MHMRVRVSMIQMAMRVSWMSKWVVMRVNGR